MTCPRSRIHKSTKIVENGTWDNIDHEYLCRKELMYMLKNKPVYNYDIEECNQLFKKGVYPIGCGVGDKDGRVFHVFTANRRYFDTVRRINYELNEKRESNM